MFYLATVKFQFTWFLGLMLALAVAFAWRAIENWSDSKGRSIIYSVVAVLFVLFALSSMITYGVSTSSST
jgi:dolichyl-phosphate-mannose--protein O-mannosyl transferase